MHWIEFAVTPFAGTEVAPLATRQGDAPCAEGKPALAESWPGPNKRCRGTEPRRNETQDLRTEAQLAEGSLRSAWSEGRCCDWDPPK